VLTSGLQIITSRLLDARKTFIVGGALILSLSRDIFPTFYASAPEALQPFVGSDLTIGVLAAVALNALFRIGVGSRQSATFSPDTVTPAAVRAFLEQQGARWGARRDVMERAIFGAAQAVESIVEHCHVQGPITVEASFDEFNLDIRIAYRGEPFEVAERRPTDVEIRESADGMRRLAGYLLQRNADRVRASRKGDLAVLEFHFQH